MPRSSQHPSRLADCLERVLGRIDPHQRLKVYRVWTFWEEEVGKTVASRAQPTGYRGGVLSVRVSGHAWMQELQFLKETIRERLNGRLGEELIRDIYFVSGAPPTPDPRPPPKAAPPNRELALFPALPKMSDPHLATVFQRIVRAHVRRPPPGRPRPKKQE